MTNKALTLTELQNRGLVSQAPQLVHGVGWSYLPLRPDYQLGGHSFRPPGYSTQELESPQTQQMLFARYLED